MSDTLERLKQVIDFELFRSKLESLDMLERKNNSGKPFSQIMNKPSKLKTTLLYYWIKNGKYKFR
jgi:hypothetical protein